MSIVKFTRVRDVKLPLRGHDTDAGIDFFIPKITDKFLEDLITKNPLLSSFRITEHEGKKCILLAPQERVNIPSGIHCLMNEPGRALIAANKSGIASKFGLVFGAQVVDYEYQGEIHINVINTSSDIVYLFEDMKIIQFLEMPVYTSTIVEVETLKDLYSEESKRGAGGFGSTGI